MDKKKLRELADGSTDDRAIEKFDQVISNEVIKPPKLNFTADVMGAIQRRAATRMGFFQVWSIILGVVVATVLWAIEGFAVPDIKLAVNLPQVSQVQSVDVTNMTMVFMMVNALLVLLLIDRWFQHKKRTAH
jgi:xanthine/uracil permease